MDAVQFRDPFPSHYVQISLSLAKNISGDLGNRGPEAPEKDWPLDIRLLSDQFAADRSSMILKELILRQYRQEAI